MSGERLTDQLRGPLDASGESTSHPGVTPGVVFVLAADGVRHLNRFGDGFLGHPPSEVFWSDALSLVHEDDLPVAEAMISEVVLSPGISLSAELRFRDVSGSWRLMDTCVQNVLEAPGDVGLVVVNVRAAAPRDDRNSLS